jgi:hypothetical protein
VLAGVVAERSPGSRNVRGSSGDGGVHDEPNAVSHGALGRLSQTPPTSRAARDLVRRTGVIVALHVATGAAAGAASRSRFAALLLGPVVHLAGDRLPHQDFHSRRLEIASGIAGILLLAVRRGPLDPATIGAAASSAPDLEHVFPFLRPGSRKLFHDRLGWHRAGRFSAYLQLLLAVAILGALIARRRKAT